MFDESTAATALMAVAKPVIKSVVDVYVTPKLKNFKEKFTNKEDSKFIPNEEHFKEYLERTYKRVAIVNTLAFKNSQKFLSEIYQPLTIISVESEKKGFKVTGFPAVLSDEYGNILITDTAGMGKSTLMKVIFLDVISKKIGIPILIELRRLTSSHGIVEEMNEQFSPLAKQFKEDLLLQLLAEGGFIVFLDGYDEIALSERDSVTANIQNFIFKAPNNRYFITSRPESALASFGNFKEFQIQPLKKNEAFELLGRYDAKGPVSSLLIKKIKEQEVSSIDEFLTNPLLVSLLFTAFEYKQAIPFSKYTFYRQVFDANFEKHDLTKGDSYTHEKHCKLETDQFHRVLRHIGYACMKDHRIEFTKDELLMRIRNSKQFCVGVDFSESNFLKDLLLTVPLFIQDGSYYRWAHKSLQEYFAAQFIYFDSKEKQNDILLRIYNHENFDKFYNILDLYYDMDYKAFRNTIELSLLKDYQAYNESSYQGKFDGIDKKQITWRKSLLFLLEVRFADVPYKGRMSSAKGELTNELEDLIKNIIHHQDTPRFKFHTFRLTPEKGQDLQFAFLADSRLKLIKLLASKKSTLVQYIPPTTWKNFDFNGVAEKKFVWYKLDDSSDHPLNTEPFFSNVNDCLQYLRLGESIINHDNAFVTLKTIENDMAQDLTATHLFDF